MTGTLSELVESFSGLSVAVVGDAMLDRYVEGETARLSAEAPVPVVSLVARRELPGGAANTAANLRALGARVSVVSLLGDDEDGAALVRALAERGVVTEGLVSEPGRRTLVKSRVVASGQMVLRLDEGSTRRARPDVEDALVARLGEAFAASDALVVSDYGYGVLTDRLIAALAGLQAESPRVLVVDSKNLAAYRAAGVTAVKPNYAQALALLGSLAGDDDAARRTETIAASGERILDVTGAEVVAVTLDSEGALVLERGRPAYRTYARPNPDSRAMGAGDTFAAALALALAAGAHTPAAAEIASAAAAIVVAKQGTAACAADELLESVLGESKYVTERARLESVLRLHREQGRRIVFTNGCFDILHRGHITYLSRAKALGDVLVVGLNSDASVGRLKGPGRPINTLEDRAQVLAALSAVDHIVPFDEDTPVELVKAVRPDVFAKGGDYTRAMLPEAPVVEAHGGTVHLLQYVEDRSTTGIIERIRKAEAVSADGS
ncbi:MAG: D-glycero-beta-D-manno-heptose 1-phosphate adenylyltransferase [Actinomycetota bacterium]|nr:D-glycero-beta-D-manno-heptose 1-phosphate adenylyltransferase [Actinomycetota bacterium]